MAKKPRTLRWRRRENVDVNTFHSAYNGHYDFRVTNKNDGFIFITVKNASGDDLLFVFDKPLMLGEVSGRFWISRSGTTITLELYAPRGMKSLQYRWAVAAMDV
jgi:hypothetical protein